MVLALLLLASLFQSLIGSLKTFGIQEGADSYLGFQSLIGSLKTWL